MDRISCSATFFKIAFILTSALQLKVHAQDHVVNGTRPTVYLKNGTWGQVPCSVEAEHVFVHWFKDDAPSPVLLVSLDTYFNVGEKSGPGYADGSSDITANYSLNVTDVALENSGQYICSVDLLTGKTEENRINVTVYVAPEEPYPVLQPCINSLDQSTNEDCIIQLSNIEGINISCSVNGLLPPITLYFLYVSENVSQVQMTERENGDGTYNKTVTIIAYPSSEPYTCFAALDNIPANLKERTSTIRIRHHPILQPEMHNRPTEIAIVLVLFVVSVVIPMVVFGVLTSCNRQIMTVACSKRTDNRAMAVDDDDASSATGAHHLKYRERAGFKYKQSMKLLIPFRFKTNKNNNYSPLDSCGFMSFAWLTWMSPLFVKAYKRTLEYVDLWTISDYERGEYNGDRLEKYWQEEVAKKGERDASLGKVALRFIATRQVISIIAIILTTMSAFLTSTILVQRLLRYVEDESDNRLWYGLVLVACILFLNIIRIGGHVFFWAFSCRTATRLRSGTLSMAFGKLAHLRSLKGHSVGKIVNVCANDSQRLFEFCIIGNYLASSIVMLIATLLAIQLIIGTGALIGTLVVFFIFVPLMACTGKLIAGIRGKCIVLIDLRVQKMNEILTHIKLIKMYAWETPFGKAITAIRSKERALLERAGILQSFNVTVIPILTLAAATSIIIHVGLGNTLTASEAFTLVTVLNVMRIVMGPTSVAIKMLAEANVALRRLKAIMILKKMQPNEPLDETSENMVEISLGTFGWDVIEAEEDHESDMNKSKGKERKDSSGRETNGTSSYLANRGATEGINNDERSILNPALFDIDFILKKGTLTGVCGLVGSGKSSLIAAILGQMEKMRGSCKVRGSFAYVAQEAWIFNATVQDNILFGKEMDRDRYKAVLTACSLKTDMESLMDGDQTEIGERGINLSGGQKQRVSLARAVYADNDVYLLDDPLSAVDAHVGEHIFNNCIKGALHGKTVLLNTHQLQFLQDCDSICVLKEGRVAEYGTHRELMDGGEEYARLINTHYTKLEGDEEHVKKTLSTKHKGQHIRQQSISRSTEADERIASLHEDLTTAEQRAGGGVKWDTLSGYIRAMGGFFFALVIGISYLLLMGLITINTWWLSYWIEISGNRPYNETTDGLEPTLFNDPQLGFYMGIYGGLLVAILLMILLKSVIFTKLTLRASTKLHSTLFQKVLRSPMSFFDTTPTGRILSRFSKDMDEIDVLLSLYLELTLMTSALITASILIITAVFPYFLVAVLPIVIGFYFIMRFYRKGISDLKQLENVSRSPWFSHIGSTATGLNTIHAYNKTKHFIQKFVHLLDMNAHPMMLFRMASRWGGARLELLVVFVIFVTNLMVVLNKGQIPASIAGLAVSFAMQLIGMFQLLLSTFADTEGHFLSAERILEYNKSLEAEAPTEIEENRPDKEWPKEGSITFSEYQLRYREELPLVLKNVNCTVRPGEKIGIVGRTGSGKSTLSVALFRLVEAYEGSILVDGINIADIGLKDLRSKISIIPQDPVLFIGTVRYNLDPFSEHSDDDLWKALEKAYMKDRIRTLDHQLEAPVTEGGDNFSVGERQLMCMARALLRNSKILFLDEATAAVDTETDSLIQETIRSAFSNFTTLTIAHRLNTVLDSDRILVMDDGRVAEFDTPSNLRSNPKSIFAGMVASAVSHNEGILD